MGNSTSSVEEAKAFVSAALSQRYFENWKKVELT